MIPVWAQTNCSKSFTFCRGEINRHVKRWSGGCMQTPYTPTVAVVANPSRT